MIGTIISRCELRARWSYAEVTGRFADTYRKNHTDSASVALLTKIADGAVFADLTHTDRDILVGWFETGLRKDYANAMQWYDTFKCESWSKEKLMRLNVLPCLDPQRQGRIVPLLSFLTSPRSLEDSDDPRVAADKVPLNERYRHKEPLVVGHWDNGLEVLWDGYFRAALFARSEDPNAEIFVWVPFEGNWPGKK
jgi:hypothetical protein